ncbi:unnamed protein product [Miscanthus lutarioriparius]|uniref:DUF4219 domain-containing protein n=1 Tax=Miscanthus lutarioriparius TaxID=422564 RepID=A0A811R2G7_9POAL|nr:unnamed protein product [Miscanthus lutarioriparius]
MGDRSTGGGGGGGGDWITYPPLTATNYTSWSISVQAIMEDQGVWEIMEPSGETSDQGTMTVRFVSEERIKEARLQTLKSEFDGLRMKEEESIDVYAGKLTRMSVRYANLGGTLDDAALVKKLFDTMLERYINAVVGIEQFYDLKKLAFDEAVGWLKAYEERTKQGAGGAKSDTDQVLLTQAEWEAWQKWTAVVESVQQGTETQTDTIHGQTTDVESAAAQNADLDQGDMDMGDSSDYDEEPLSFRSLNEVYQDSVEVELTFDTGVDALLAVMEEPKCYKEAAGDRDWVAAM